MKRNSIKLFLNSLAYLLTIHIAALVIFGLFRLILFAHSNYVLPEEVQGDWLMQATAFVKGLWFDNVIACYLLILPLVVLWIASLCNYTAKWIYLFTGGFFIAGYALSFIITAANIPYFDYFFKIINSSIFNWFGYVSTTAGMIAGESSYYFPIALGIGSVILWGLFIHFFSKYMYEQSLQYRSPWEWKGSLCIFVMGAACVGLCLFGIRGRMGYNPIKVSQAYYCEDPFLNQLGVNPVFNLMTSTLDDHRAENKRLHLMDNQEAITIMQRILNRKGIEGISPIAQEVKPDTTSIRKNIVMIFMESMSAKLMQTFGAKHQLTPYLDSLYHQSIHFDNTYSAGIHTNHGLYASLYSFPAVMKRNAMKGTVIPTYSGLPTVLKENGYQNLFFMTHESQYDNMNAFFRTNGFDEIYSQENYPKEKIANHFGVPDDYLYEYALPVLNKRAQEGKPFFSVLLSISNHPPYVIPSYFKPKSELIEEQIVEYADWSIRQFMTATQKQPWFKETIFVFFGDHGKMIGNPENEMPESYNHIPLFIYNSDFQPKQAEGFSGQIDIAPTILGLLNISYTQNNFGKDVLKDKRSSIVYTADNMIAARDSSHLYFYSPESQQEFFYEVHKDGVKKTTDNLVFQKLKQECFATLQSTEHLVEQQMTIDKIKANND